MIMIPEFITSRINAQLKEISVGDMIDLCHLPVEYNEKGISKVIASIVADTNLPIEQWTAQERYAAMLQYFMYAYYDGENIAITDNIYILDYSIADKDYPVSSRKSLTEAQSPEQEFAYRFLLDGESDNPDDLWMLPLTGKWMEAIERVVLGGYIKGEKNKAEAWRIAQAAAQILPVGVYSDEIIATHNMSIDQYISNNVNLILDLSQVKYNQLMMAFDAGQKHLDHLVRLRAFDEGFVMEGGDGELPPYRFQFTALVDSETWANWATDEILSGHDAA